MAIYWILIFSILAFASFSSSWFDEKQQQEKATLWFGIIFLFLLCALKGESVGADIQGYRRMYDYAASVPWEDFSGFVHFETGYVVLIKIFAKMGWSFQAFTWVIYAMIYIPLFFFIKKNSKDVVVSLIIFICYQTFVFVMSGLRQAIATGVCMAVMSCALKPGIVNFLKFAIGVYIASLLHESALVFILFYFVVRIRLDGLTIIFYALVCILSVMFRDVINAFISTFFREVNANIKLGGSFLFLIGIVIFGYLSERRKKFALKDIVREDTGEIVLEDVSMQILLMSILCHLVFTGSTMQRATMYYTMFFISIIPNYLTYHNEQERVALRWAMIVFMIVLFYTETLSVNQLWIIPYKFFWEA